jgi:hypothetical protein
VEKASTALEPPLDLSLFSGQSTPLGSVAALLDEFDDETSAPELNEIVAELEKEIVRWNESHCLGMNPDDLPDSAEIRRIAREQVLTIARLMHDQLDNRP